MTNVYNPSLYKQIAELEPGSFWFRSRNRLILWAIRKYFPGAKSLLEVGCGTGFVLSAIAGALPGAEIFGAEFYFPGLEIARKRLGARARFVQADVRALPFRDAFDVIGAFDILEHLEEDGLALSAMHRALRRGGGLVVTAPRHKFLWSRTDDDGCHVRRYGARELKGKAERAGFKTVDIVSFISLLFPVMMLARFWKRRPGKSDIMSELSLGPAANALLEKAMDLERAIVRTGFRPPFGGSLLLVAKKE